MDYKKIFEEKGLCNIQKFFLYMQNNFDYGWISQDGNRHIGVNDAKCYCLESPMELLESHLGICWDMTELSRCFFETMTSFKFETYYLFYDDNKGCPSHSILVFYDNDKVYWFEPMFQDNSFYYSGIHEYDSIHKLLDDFKNVFLKSSLIKGFIPKDYNPGNVQLYKYEKPKEHINGFEMRDHINHSEFIDLLERKKL